MNTIGIDIGSLTTKVVVLGEEGIRASAITESGDEAEASARRAVSDALARIGLSLGEDAYMVSTGVGGKSISFSQQQKAITTCLARGTSRLLPEARMVIEAITTCLARGTSRLLPEARMVIDMGAESCTVVKLNQRGRVDDWATHDKCAAGTGMFLQQMARLMQIPMEEMSTLSQNATGRADITSTCAVFAESDVISHVHRDPPTPKEDIAAGIYYSIATRIVSLCKRVGIARDSASASASPGRSPSLVASR
jgi:activator of 2-hydroxyglutaryl-CoA dehydratase